MHFLFYTGLSILVLFYIVAPFLLKFSHTHAQHRSRRPVNVDDLPEVARKGIESMVRELTPLGYQVASHTFSKAPVPNVNSGEILFIKRDTGDTAEGIYCIPATMPPVWAFLFRTIFSSGRSVLTTSSKSPKIWPPDPSCASINVSWIKSPAVIHRIHRARVERVTDDPIQPPPVPGDEISYLDRRGMAELDRVVRFGYLWLDESAQVYRATFKGAYLMTWRILPPLKQIRRMHRIFISKRELRRLHLD